MSSEPRGDLFRPSAIDPSEFEFYGLVDLHHLTDVDARTIEEVESNFRRPRTGEYSASQCDHCGMHIRYACIFEHLPTQSLVVFGEICTHNTLGMQDRVALEAKRARDAAAALRKREQEEVARAQGIVEAKKNYPEAFAILNRYEGDNDFIKDVAARLTRRGTLTEKQANAVVAAHKRDQERRKQVAKAESVPEGRCVIEGVVVKTDQKIDRYRTRSSYYRTVYKFVMTVRDDRGFAVWGTIPKAIFDEGYNIETLRGMKVRFTADLQRSDKEGFGFFKRPHNAEVIKQEEK